ncbi:MAG: DEAD/DEAH box helicase [Nitrospirales bacterium]|nr:DEAD/DEAH box helicase [Nitrospirales bacterium]
MFNLLNAKGQPFQAHQSRGVQHVLRYPKCALWARPGAGKTAILLTAYDTLALSGEVTGPLLVISTLRIVRDVWPAEPAKWPHLQHLKVSPIVGTAVERRDAMAAYADVYTVNVENLPWLLAELGDRWPYGMVAVDESTKFKSLRASIRKNKDGTTWVQGQGAVRAKELLRAVFRHRVSHFVELTGTPAPNGLQDLWGQVFFLDYGQRLGRVFDAFRNRWFRSKMDGFGIEPLVFAQGEIEGALTDICLTLEPDYTIDEPIVHRIAVTLPPEVRKQYREMERKAFAEIQGHPIDAFNAGARTGKLLQFASGVAYLGSPDDPGERKWLEVHQEKLRALEDLVEESGGMPLLVAYHFKPDLLRLKKHFKDARELDHKPSTLADWNKGKIPILLTHPASAGHGLDLQYGSNILVDFTCTWNSEEHWQILERIGPLRQKQAGLNRPVYRYHLVAEKTVDEDVLLKHETGRSVQDILMDAMRTRVENA